MTNRTDHIGRGCLPLLPMKRMALCEANGVDFLFGRAKNERLIAEIRTELDVVGAKSRRTGRVEWTTRGSGAGGAGSSPRPSGRKTKPNPRFVVTSLEGQRPGQAAPAVPCAGVIDGRKKNPSRARAASRSFWKCRPQGWEVGRLVALRFQIPEAATQLARLFR
jgi:hypothetical protein